MYGIAASELTQEGMRSKSANFQSKSFAPIRHIKSHILEPHHVGQFQ